MLSPSAPYRSATRGRSAGTRRRYRRRVDAAAVQHAIETTPDSRWPFCRTRMKRGCFARPSDVALTR